MIGKCLYLQNKNKFQIESTPGGSDLAQEKHLIPLITETHCL